LMRLYVKKACKNQVTDQERQVGVGRSRPHLYISKITLASTEVGRLGYDREVLTVYIGLV
jgi:hypothetical protein